MSPRQFFAQLVLTRNRKDMERAHALNIAALAASMNGAAISKQLRAWTGEQHNEIGPVGPPGGGSSIRVGPRQNGHQQ